MNSVGKCSLKKKFCQMIDEIKFNKRHILKSALFFNKISFKLIKSLFIDEFKEDIKTHKVKFINEKKDRVTVLHIENLTKPLYQVFPKRLVLTI